MPTSLRLAILITDIAFLAYWMVGLASLAGLFTLLARKNYPDAGGFPLAYFLFGELPGSRVLLGALILLVGVALAVVGGRR